MNEYRENRKHSFQYKLLAWIVAAVLATLSVVGVYQYYRARALEQELENQYMRSFHDMTDYMRDVDVLLKKSMLAADTSQLASISSELFMQSASAKACLAQLPTDDGRLGDASKFLSQVGDYASYLSGKTMRGEDITDTEFDNLMQLSSHAASVSESLEALREQLYAQNLSLKSVLGLTAHASEDEDDEPSGLYILEKEFQNYPTLIYDGPFSEHIDQAEPAAISGKPEFSRDEALTVASHFVGNERAEGLAYAGESTGRIAAYSFSAEREDGSQLAIDVTRRGGMVLWMLDSRPVGEQSVSVEAAVSAGSEFLRAMGYFGMKESYYERVDNTVTINYAYVGQNVIMYSDLIKVKIALDDGAVIGFESHGYIMSHTERDLPAVTLSESEARAQVNRRLKVDGIRLAMIPLESSREVLCYECRGNFNGQNYLIYINAQTGYEERILLLLESAEGVLTM